jgi:DivIVA domain-containing protein
VPIPPEEIVRKRFLITLRGYDRAEVDAYMRALAAEQARLLERIAELEAAPAAANPRPPVPPGDPASDSELAAVLGDAAGRLARRRRLVRRGPKGAGRG